MNIKRIFANAVARRVAVLLVAAVMAWMGIGRAHAQNYPATCHQVGVCDQGQAYADCLAGVDWWKALHSSSVGYLCVNKVGNPSFYQPVHPLNQGVCAGLNGVPCAFYYGGSCSARSDMLNASFTGNAGSCSAGCAYAPSVGGGDTYTVVTVAGLSVTKASRLAPTGEACVNGDGLGQPVTSDQCVQQSTLTQCIRPDGQHCATSSTGKQFCWSPTEAGTKASNNEAATKSPEGTNINAPSSSPPNGGDWQQQGSGTASVTSGGGTTNNYNITNWGSSYGSEGDGGTGEGDGDGDGDGPGQGTGETLGDLYTPHGKTIDSVVETWWSAAQSTPILGKINQFFGNCGYGGACPSWVYETEFTGTLSFAQLCDGTLGDIFTFGGYVVLALGAFAAFRIAIY